MCQLTRLFRGMGVRALDSLRDGSLHFADSVSSIDHSMDLPNAIPKIGDIEDSGYCGEEEMHFEAKKILHPDLLVI